MKVLAKLVFKTIVIIMKGIKFDYIFVFRSLLQNNSNIPKIKNFFKARTVTDAPVSQ